MGSGQPFLARPYRASAHDPPQQFNPKAVSEASLRTAPVREKKQGPLLSLNRHPDSYVAPPYGRTAVKPMSHHTRGRVQFARLSQLSLRVAQLVVVLGLAVCVICVRGVRHTEGWILRVPVRVYPSLYELFKTDLSGDVSYLYFQSWMTAPGVQSVSYGSLYTISLT